MNKMEPRHTPTPGNVRLFVAEASGMRKSRRDIGERNPDMRGVASSSTSCKQPSASCVEARALSASCRRRWGCQVPLHIRQNPSVGLGSRLLALHLLGFFFFPCEDLLQAKTIKANGLRTFEGTDNKGLRYSHIHRMFNGQP